MITITQVSQTIRQLLTAEAEELAVTTGFIQRCRKVTGATFSQMLVLGWLDNPNATLEELCQMGAAAGLSISAQGLDQRFTEQASQFMETLLLATLQQVFSAQPVAVPLLQRFNGVYLYDSSIVTLPDTFREQWAGFGGRVNTSQSALKLHVCWNMVDGGLEGPLLCQGREHDRVAIRKHSPLPAGALRLADLGYWKLDDFRQLSEQGSYWLSRLQAQTKIVDENQQVWSQADYLKQGTGNVVDVTVQLGTRARLPARLIAVRVPPKVAAQRRRALRENARSRGQTVSQTRLTLADWTLLVTNIPPDELTIEEALVLLRLRWQIELLFKLWKSHGGLTTWRSQKPWRILCELYAKLIAMIIQYWCFLLGSWSFPDRSLVKAAQTVRQFALSLTLSLSSLRRLRRNLRHLVRLLAEVGRKNKSRKEPRIHQLLLAAREVNIA